MTRAQIIMATRRALTLHGLAIGRGPGKGKFPGQPISTTEPTPISTHSNGRIIPTETGTGLQQEFYIFSVGAQIGFWMASPEAYDARIFYATGDYLSRYYNTASVYFSDYDYYASGFNWSWGDINLVPHFETVDDALRTLSRSVFARPVLTAGGAQ